MEYSPPPLFKQGASARAKVVFFSLFSIALLLADSRLQSLGVIRQTVGTALYPLQVVALMPRDALYSVGDYFVSLTSLENENRDLKRERIANAQALQQAQQLLAENTQLRKLLGTSARLEVKSVMSEILYDARDAFTRKIILDRGAQHGVAAGQPVIDDVGVVGQVTRVFPLTSEVTLLTDKDQAIPVQAVRNGLRSVAYGRGQSGVLELRFMAANADIQKGDLLTTSGIDGVYPAGLSVATVSHVENKSGDSFARIVCQPAAGIDRNRQLLILLTEPKLSQLPEAEPVSIDKKAKSGKAAVSKEAVKEPPKESPKESPKQAPKAAVPEPVKAPAQAVVKPPAAPVSEPVKPVAAIVAPAATVVKAQPNVVAPVPAPSTKAPMFVPAPRTAAPNGGAQAVPDNRKVSP